jgi:hypothetical protein
MRRINCSVRRRAAQGTGDDVSVEGAGEFPAEDGKAGEVDDDGQVNPAFASADEWWSAAEQQVDGFLLEVAIKGRACLWDERSPSCRECDPPVYEIRGTVKNGLSHLHEVSKAVPEEPLRLGEKRKLLGRVLPYSEAKPGQLNSFL